MCLLVRVQKHCDLTKLQVANFDYKGYVTDCSTFSFITVPYIFSDLFQPFVMDGYFILNGLKATSLDGSHEIVLPEIEIFKTLDKIIFDVDTVKL